MKHPIADQGTVLVFRFPVNISWGQRKLTALCEAALERHPRHGDVFLFFNTNRDQLKVICFQDGYREIIKWLPRGSFTLPTPRSSTPFSNIKCSTLDRILEIDGSLTTSPNHGG